MGQSKRNYENLIIMNSQSFYDYEYYNLIQSNDKRRSTPQNRKGSSRKTTGTSRESI